MYLKDLKPASALQATDLFLVEQAQGSRHALAQDVALAMFPMAAILGLGDSTSATKGAALVGWGASLSYPPSTVGGEINAILAAINLLETQAHAASTYETIMHAASIYETQTHASTTYTSLTSLAARSTTDQGAGMIGYDASFSYGLGTQGHHNSREIYVTDAPWLAKFDGVTDDSAAINAASLWLYNNGRGTLRLGRGTTIVGNLNLYQGVSISGPGIRGSCTLQANAANTPIFKNSGVDPTFEGITIEGFIVKAHASGSTGPAIDCSGASGCLIRNIEYRDNSPGTFSSMFDISSNPYFAYGLHFDKIYCNNQKAPARIWRFHNNGTTSANNSNVGSIRNCEIINNTNISKIIDGVRSSSWSVSGCLFENNSGATVISPGQGWTIGPANWFELNSHNIVYEAPESGSRGENGNVFGNYFTTADTIDCTLGRGNVWFNNIEVNAQTFINNGDGLNLKLKQQEVLISPPTISYGSGQTGTLTLVSNSRVGSHLIDGCSFQLQYTWTATVAATVTELVLSVPTGYVLESMTASMLRGASGEPAKVGETLPGHIWVANQFNDSHSMYVFVKYRRNLS
jgi:hypothetical protein